jgi:hypothetical protein
LTFLAVDGLPIRKALPGGYWPDANAARYLPACLARRKEGGRGRSVGRPKWWFPKEQSPPAAVTTGRL